MKMNFDKEVFDYLLNDLCLIFKEKQDIIDTNQSNIIKEILETKDLTDILSEIFSEDNIEFNINFEKKQKKLINDIDYLECLVNNLNNEIENLNIQVNVIEENVNKL